MYFNDDKKFTNIDNEFENDNILSNILNLLNKYKIIIIIFLLLVIGIIVIIYFNNNNVKNVINYLVLNGDESITIYQDSDYIELGFEAYNSKNENLTNDVIIKSNLDTSKIGYYEIIYTIGDVTKTRKINVIAKPKDYTYIYLKTVDNSVNIYLKVGEMYMEPGYQVFSSTGKNLTNQVKIDGVVDTSKRGNYKLIYSVVDSNNVTISVSRTVIVMDTEINLSLSTEEYTNKDVIINIKVIDDYFDHLILPNNNKVADINYSYKVGSNGTYKFKVHNKKGIDKEASIEVKNIDKEAPTGSCSGSYGNGKSTININANDNIGINKYVIDGISYTNNSITINKELSKVTVTIFDKSGNTKNISCNLTAIAPSITNISKDGVIITVTSKNIGSKISGYYFSYDSQRPDKKTGGYVATSDATIDVVRLQGTTYVWVEDVNGNISSPKTIKVSSSDIPITNGSRLNVVSTSNYPLDATQVKNFDNLIYRSSRAAGLYSKEAAATSALAVLYVSSQKYGFTYGYKYGKQSYALGNKILAYTGDCDGFVNWSYVNAGYDFQKYHPNVSNNYYLKAPGYPFNSANGEPGDVLRKKGHTAIIVGKNDDGFLIAEAYSTSKGHLISLYKYNLADHYVIKGEWLEENYAYSRYSRSDYPSGY